MNEELITVTLELPAEVLQQIRDYATGTQLTLEQAIVDLLESSFDFGDNEWGTDYR
jgi:hypothetical protein